MNKVTLFKFLICLQMRVLNHFHEPTGGVSILVIILFCIVLAVCLYFFYWHNLIYTTYSVSETEEKEDV